MTLKKTTFCLDSYTLSIETGFYYLQSRYYDPIIKRFLNADAFASTGQGFLGYNMFAYCGNNPVDCSDPSGQWIEDIFEKIKEKIKTVVTGAINFYLSLSRPSGSTHTNEIRDVTEEVDRALKDAMWDGFIVNRVCGDSPLLYISKLIIFRNEVDHKAPWDIKRESSWEKTIGTPFPGDVIVLYHEMELSPENLGNVTYGVLGRAYGIDFITLLGGSYVAAGLPTEGPALENEITVDQPFIYIGYYAIFPILYNKFYGDGG